MGHGLGSEPRLGLRALPHEYYLHHFPRMLITQKNRRICLATCSNSLTDDKPDRAGLDEKACRICHHHDFVLQSILIVQHISYLSTHHRRKSDFVQNKS